MTQGRGARRTDKTKKREPCWLLGMTQGFVVREVPYRMATIDVGGADLATQVVAQWEKSGSHRAAKDLARDRAVLHAGNTAAFEEIVAAMDAIHAAERRLARGSVAAFDVVFAVD
jgi:hypothetical protein